MVVHAVPRKLVRRLDLPLRHDASPAETLAGRNWQETGRGVPQPGAVRRAPVGSSRHGCPQFGSPVRSAFVFRRHSLHPVSHLVTSVGGQTRLPRRGRLKHGRNRRPSAIDAFSVAAKCRWLAAPPTLRGSRRGGAFRAPVWPFPAGTAIARLVAAHEDTVRDVIHAFNERGLDALDPLGGRPSPPKPEPACCAPARNRHGSTRRRGLSYLDGDARCRRPPATDQRRR
jgi:hypothetical protein